MASDMKRENAGTIGADGIDNRLSTKANADATWVAPCATVLELPITITQPAGSPGNDGNGTTTQS